MGKAVKKLWHAFSYLLEFAKYYALYPVAVWKYRGRKIYLIAERGTDARDNGYHFFSYIRKQHPELEVYYVISKGSADLPKVQALGNVVYTGSLAHYLLFIAAEYKISTHIAGYSPYVYFYTRFVNKIHWRGKKIFLQHGVTMSEVKMLYYEKTLVDLFTCGAKPEFDDVAARYHYNGQVKYTGLARYDALYDLQLKDQLLLMPTWRLYLSGRPAAEVATSEYVKRWNGVLNDKRLIEAAKKHGVQIVFYPHYEAQKFIEAFTSCDEQVTIADFAHYDVQQLLKESKLLVTDYSSVHLDFCYMNKPCVYYQFDADRFYSEHYQKGYFDFETMGFGEVLKQHDALVECLIRYIQSGFAMDEEYKERQRVFFPLHDRDNCKRIMEEIQKL